MRWATVWLLDSKLVEDQQISRDTCYVFQNAAQHALTQKQACRALVSELGAAPRAGRCHLMPLLCASRRRPIVAQPTLPQEEGERDPAQPIHLSFMELRSG